SSDVSATVVGTTAPVSVATTVPSVVPSSSSGAGVRSAGVGGPSVILIVGAGFSGSAAPSAGISIHAISPTSHVWMTGKWMSPAVVGAGKEIAKGSSWSAASGPPVNSNVSPVTVAVQPALSTAVTPVTPVGIWNFMLFVGEPW